MGRSVDEGKRIAWQQRLARYARCDRTVAAFCAVERVTVPTFYQWKQKLGAEAVGGGERRKPERSPSSRAFLPVRIEGTALVEIELPNGARVHVPVSDVGAIRVAVLAAGEVLANDATEPPRC
jgi:hypothetical protein